MARKSGYDPQSVESERDRVGDRSTHKRHDVYAITPLWERGKGESAGTVNVGETTGGVQANYRIRHRLPFRTEMTRPTIPLSRTAVDGPCPSASPLSQERLDLGGLLN
jgi:hypothetical protein